MRCSLYNMNIQSYLTAAINLKQLAAALAENQFALLRTRVFGNRRLYAYPAHTLWIECRKASTA